jgi:uncharacterized membrane protein YedE/YeeE
MDLNPVYGGILIGVASALLFVFNGRIAGISGIAGGLLRQVIFPGHRIERETFWRFAFVLGLIIGGWVIAHTAAFASFAPTPSAASLPLLVLAGLLVGFGTRLGWGCTSGHGICGIARFSPRSLFATGVFVVTGMVTVAVLRHVFGLLNG